MLSVSTGVGAVDAGPAGDCHECSEVNDCQDRAIYRHCMPRVKTDCSV